MLTHIISRLTFAAVPLTAALFFGPPSIKVVLVTDRAAAPTPGAVLDVTAQHHVEGEPLNVTGKMEGLVAGRRITRPLTVTATATRGRFGVAPQWEVGKPWVLVLTTGMGEHGTAVALVRIGSDGRIAGIDSPNSLRAMGKPLPAEAVESEVKVALGALGAK
ncbi:MAG: hypothetical protein ABIZ70_07560 [Gemmatimonadales bacterium]